MENVRYEKRGHTGLITLDKAADLNALNAAFIQEINNALDQAEQDEDVYVLILTGTGKAFIAGADIAEMYEKDRAAIMEWSALGSGLNLRLENMKIPVIAAINGYALGGGLELALACDIRLASQSVKLGLPETSLGVICGAGGTQRLPRIVGEGMAKELIFTADVIDARQALNIGLVNRIVPAEDLMDAAFQIADAIGKNGPIAIRAAKKAIAFSNVSSIEEGCHFEREVFSRLFETEDQKIGMGGFLRKEKNVTFKNR
ncbi:MAG: crotonase [Firmicutes bacterium]|jgi:enoyl-CoA hydratase|nr:crotonase [Bacillota bacterium]NBI61800.1 crotonase [Clostridiales bacterium]